MPINLISSQSGQNIVILIGRVLMSAIFIWEGYHKLVDPAGTAAQFESLGLPLPWLAWLLAVIIELLGGLALLVGIEARLAALILGLWCIATAIVAHSNFADSNMQIHFMKNVAMAGGFAVITVVGAGSYSLDAVRNRAFNGRRPNA